MKCPIDDEPCEGANGRKNSPTCLHRCENGQKFVEGYLATIGIRHGNAHWAKRVKCKCPKCSEALKELKRKETLRISEKRAAARALRPPLKKDTHGSFHKAVRERCACSECFPRYTQYLADKREQNKARRDTNKKATGKR